MSEVYENLKKTVQEMRDYQEKNPQAIAVACQPQYYDFIKSKFDAKKSLNSVMDLAYFPIYNWARLPEPCKIYYNEQLLLVDICRHGNVGDNYMGRAGVASHPSTIIDL
jgi:hypothetical protein